MENIELRKRLRAYPDDLEVKIFINFGSGYVVSPIEEVINRHEATDEGADEIWLIEEGLE